MSTARTRARLERALDLLATRGLAGDGDAVARAWRELVLACGELERVERREAESMMIGGALLRPATRGAA